MKLIVGLGNPGEKYAGNRHNIGFLAVNEIARGYAFGPWKRRFQGHAAEGQIGLEKCILLKPGTYMNESGRSVGEVMRFYKLPIGDVIVVHDELDLKPGTIRVKTGGGNAGHNGLKSISAHIGNEYTRVRLGIGHPGDKTLVSNYVLQDFAKSDRDWLEPLLEGVARGMARLVEGSEAAFLSEAARGRSKSAPAAKPNGAPILAPASIAAPDVEAGTLALIAAASSRLIQPMPVPPIHVAAARESGGGAVSSAAMIPEPKSGPDAAAIREASRALNPIPAAMIEREPAVEETPPLPAAAQIEWGPSGAAPAETVSPVPKGAASKAPAAPEQRKKGGLFSSLFRSRSRGGVTD